MELKTAGAVLGSTALAAEGSRRLSLNHNDGSFILTAPTWDLMVAKDIMVRSGANPAHITSPDGYAAISLVDNTFQQTTSPSAAPLHPAAVMAISTMVLGALFAPLRRRISAGRASRLPDRPRTATPG